MKSTWSKESEAILGVGRSLADVGVRNWALTREQALAALDRFTAKDIAILGGDVYELRKERLQPNYDNWHCDRSDSESRSDYVSRSNAEARDYITRYMPQRNVEYYFVIVPES